MKRLALMALAVLVVVGGNGLFGDNPASVDITVTLTNWYYLSVNTMTLTFNDVIPAPFSDPPPTTTKLFATENDVSITAGGVLPTAQKLHLYISAPDLTGGAAPILIGAIAWTAPTGAGFNGGTLATTNVEIGNWSGSIWHWHTGTLRFSFLRNYETQSPGTYTSKATVTVSNV